MHCNQNIKAMEIKITKRTLAHEVNNDMVHNYYYYVQGRIYNDDNTRYKKFGFIVWFDVEDLAEFYEDKDIFTKKDILNYVDEMSFCCFTDYIKAYDDCKYFYEICRQSIENYNKILPKQRELSLMELI